LLLRKSFLQLLLREYGFDPPKKNMEQLNIQALENMHPKMYVEINGGFLPFSSNYTGTLAQFNAYYVNEGGL